ncbi:MAG TPA: MarR family transcriptional regulator [Kiloniellales bacterium]|nr:MarR family transcriptional regulator [Kiloniellales bacterium]
MQDVPKNFVLDDQIGHLIRRAHQRASATFMAVLAEYNMTPTQFFAMARLRERGELSQNLLGRLAAMDPATIQGVIRRLQDRGYIARKPDPNDRRRALLSLTASGRKTIDEMLRRIDTVNHQILAPLAPDEREQLRGLLKRIV